MDLVIRINLDNAAFEDDGYARAGEIYSVLRSIPFAKSSTYDPEIITTLIDSNGNTCGSVTVEE